MPGALRALWRRRSGAPESAGRRACSTSMEAARRVASKPERPWLDAREATMLSGSGMKRGHASTRLVGVFPDSALREAASAGWIAATHDLSEAQFQPASLDLRLGPTAYQLRASFLPFRQSVQTRLQQNDFTDVDLVI